MNLPRVVHQPRENGGMRASLVRGLLGQPAQSKNEAVLHDSIDLIPVLGDIPGFIRVMSNKGNRAQQLTDALIGAIPIIGDLADLFLASDTNMQQFSHTNPKLVQKGTVETILTGSFIPNIIERYVGGVDRPIWHD